MLTSPAASAIIHVVPIAHGKRKQSLYFPLDVLDEIQAEATRLDRSASWVVQRAWSIARAEMRGRPSAAPKPEAA